MTKTIDTAAIRSLADRMQIYNPQQIVRELCDEVDRLRALDPLILYRAEVDRIVERGRRAAKVEALREFANHMDESENDYTYQVTFAARERADDLERGDR